MLSKLGVIRYDTEKPIKFVTKKEKEQIYAELDKAGMGFDSQGTVSGENVDKFYKGIENIIGKENVKQINTDDSYTFTTAHGANQISDTNNNEVFMFVENIANPVKTFVNSLRTK